MSHSMRDTFLEEIKPFLSKSGFSRLSELEKTAGVNDVTHEKMMDLAMAVGKTMLPLLGIAGAYKYMAHRADKNSKEQLKGSRAVLSKELGFGGNEDQFSSIFEQLSSIAPHVASNPKFANPIMKKHLETGFSVEDLNHLSKINESLANNSPTVANGGKLLAAGGLAYGLGEMNGLPQKAQGIVKSFMKTSSDAKAEESLGNITYKLCCFEKMAAKASFLSALSKGDFGGAFKKGLTSTVETAGQVSPPLLIGAGIYAATQAMGMLKERGRRENYLKSYQYIKDNLPGAQNDPRLAQEAFNTLVSFAPSVAERPLAARNFVQLAISREGIDSDLLKSVSEVENTIQNNQAHQPFGGIMEGTKNVFGLGGAMKGKKGSH